MKLCLFCFFRGRGPELRKPSLYNTWTVLKRCYPYSTFRIWMLLWPETKTLPESSGVLVGDQCLFSVLWCEKVEHHQNMTLSGVCVLCLCCVKKWSFWSDERRIFSRVLRKSQCVVMFRESVQTFNVHVEGTYCTMPWNRNSDISAGSFKL